MNIARRIAHKTEAVNGGAKKTADRATGSRRLRAEGRRDQRNAHAMHVMAKIRDAMGTDHSAQPNRSRTYARAKTTPAMAAARRRVV